MFSGVNVYIDHLKFCVVCIYGRRYVCCSECNVVSNECDGPTEGVCSMAVPAMSTRHMTSSLRIPSTHPPSETPIIGRNTLGSCP